MEIFNYNGRDYGSKVTGVAHIIGTRTYSHEYQGDDYYLIKVLCKRHRSTKVDVNYLLVRDTSEMYADESPLLSYDSHGKYIEITDASLHSVLLPSGKVLVAVKVDAHSNDQYRFTTKERYMTSTGLVAVVRGYLPEGVGDLSIRNINGVDTHSYLIRVPLKMADNPRPGTDGIVYYTVVVRGTSDAFIKHSAIAFENDPLSIQVMLSLRSYDIELEVEGNEKKVPRSLMRSVNTIRITNFKPTSLDDEY